VQHNRDLIAWLDPSTTPYLDWVVTIAFYAALHQIEAWFAGKGLHLESHVQRDDWVSRTKELRRNVWPRYKELEFQSRQARYQCSSFEREFVRGRLLSYLDDIERETGKLEQE
ncbi:MAG: hypothetical protein WAW26_21585, partial [Anaerolineae bacterium]